LFTIVLSLLILAGVQAKNDKELVQKQLGDDTSNVVNVRIARETNKKKS